jgi:L-ascorbate 6-phosphate lactonase
VAVIDLTWLGQAGFLVETGSSRLLIDPWVTPGERRLIESPPLELVCERIDCVLITHEHGDHFDVPFLRQLARRSPDAALVLPKPIANQARGALAVKPVRPGDRVELAGLTVEVVPAWHAVRTSEPYTDGDGRFVGYLIRVGGSVIYHAGDTVPTDDLISSLRHKQIDIALLPVNGRDFFREAEGMVGNLDVREAVRLAREVGARTLIPYHWDGFEGNTEQPGRVVDEAVATGELHVLCLARLIRFHFGCDETAPPGSRRRAVRRRSTAA